MVCQWLHIKQKSKTLSNITFFNAGTAELLKKLIAKSAKTETIGNTEEKAYTYHYSWAKPVLEAGPLGLRCVDIQEQPTSLQNNIKIISEKIRTNNMNP